MKIWSTENLVSKIFTVNSTLRWILKFVKNEVFWKKITWKKLLNSLEHFSAQRYHSPCSNLCNCFFVAAQMKIYGRIEVPSEDAFTLGSRGGNIVPKTNTFSALAVFTSSGKFYGSWNLWLEWIKFKFSTETKRSMDAYFFNLNIFSIHLWSPLLRHCSSV